MKYLIVLLVAAALVYGGMKYAKKPAPVKLQPSAAAITENTENKVKEFAVSGANFRFDPAAIAVNKGDRVRINFTSVDLMHDLDIDELGVDGPVIPAGETAVIEFLADKAGAFEYYCSVGQHRANGMVGRLIVSE